MTQQVTRKQTEIQQATICRCTDKATKEAFYAVKSDSQEGVWYQVRWNQQALRWQCGCPALKPCKHERAVNEVLVERRARIASQMGGEVPAIVARMQADEDQRLAERAARREAYVNEFSIY